MPISTERPVGGDLIDLLARHAPSDGIHPTRLPSLDLIRVSAPMGPIHTVQEPALCVVVQGAKRVRLGTETFTYDADRFLLVSIDLPLTGEVIVATPVRPYLALRLNLDPKIVAELAPTADVPMGERSEDGRGIAVSPLDPDLRDSLGRLLTLLETPAHLPALAPLIEREILYRLLVGPEGVRLREMALTWGGTHRIARAVEILRRDFDRPLRIDALAREVGMSPSGLHHHFKRATALSPVQFQKRLRLQAARGLMVGEGFDAASAALRVGYESPSQFSREYRRLFGAPPIRDAVRIRGEAAIPF